MDKYLSEDEVRDLIEKAKNGDNNAWEAICKNFELYVHDRAWNSLKEIIMPVEHRKDLEEDLYMAGWHGFVSAIRNFIPGKVKFLTYATKCIDEDIKDELELLLNPLGITGKPKQYNKKAGTHSKSGVSLDECPEIADPKAVDDFVNEDAARSDNNDVERAIGILEIMRILEDRNSAISEEMREELNKIADGLEKERFDSQRLALQILKVLRLTTDEDHSITIEELKELLRTYRIAQYGNIRREAPITYTSALESILLELDPLEYTGKNEGEYKIKYEGYKENRLRNRINGEKGKKAASITNFSYVHTFNNDELNKLIQLISFSDLFSYDEKNNLIKKLVGTASMYYRSPFWDGEEIRFNSKAIHRRIAGVGQEDRGRLSENLKIIQDAVNNMGQIRFKFNRYTADHVMIPKTEYWHTLSPYHLVVYHDNYYCIGFMAGDEQAKHYRVDLMSEVEIIQDEEGKIIPMEVTSFEGLPISNAAWNPEKYMAEHLNMAYDEPQDIRIKIKNTDYTRIHDWFGDYYEKTDETCEEGYDIVKVRTSPFMIVHWAMQYGNSVEIMDEEIRAKIREEIRKMESLYGKD